MNEKIIALQNIPEDAWLKVKSYLEYNGYFLDEQAEIPFSTTLMERCRSEIELMLRSHGYDGGTLRGTAKFYPKHGAVYAIFDENRIDYKKMSKILDKWVRNFDG